MIRIEGVAKHFGPVRALDGVSLDIRAGETHGIVGENGAGKSTLMKILGGIETPSSGSLRLRGRTVALRHPAEARRLGIAMIHQELSGIGDLSVADNLFLGREPTNGLILDRRAMRQKARLRLAELGCDVEPDRRLGTLSVGQRQMVEIARALAEEADVLILDEPTAVLGRRDQAALFSILATLKTRGVTLLYISHMLDEVLRLCDRISVLRDGRLVKTLDNQKVAATSERTLARLMVGRPPAEHFPPRRPPGKSPAFTVGNFTSHEVADVSFTIRRGEIFGLAGLVGSGRTELAEGLFGLRPRTAGSVRVGDLDVAPDGPQAAMRSGIAYLPEDRKESGLALGMSVTANITLAALRDYGRLWPDRARERAAADAHIKRLNIRAASPNSAVGSLSGGNQQKVLLARWLDTRPRVLLVDEPTRGVDIGAKEDIYSLLHELAADGMACLMISSELNELLGLCHRIGVMRRGRLVDVCQAADVSDQDIMEIAAATPPSAASVAKGTV